MEKFQLPIPIYTSIHIGSIEAKDGTEFSVIAGLDRDLVRQLKEKSLDRSDVELQKNTSDFKRFGEGSYDAWYAKDRTPFALVDAERKLAAVIWLGPQFLPEGLRVPSDKTWATIAFRAYEPFRGKGLMKPFSILVLETYKALRPEHRVWLETNPDNEAGKHLYIKLGFEDVGISSKNGRLVMAMAS